MHTLTASDSLDRLRRSDRRRRIAALAALGAALLVLAVLGVAVGSVPVAPDRIWAVLAAKAGLGGEPTTLETTIVWTLRLPRVAMAVVVGATLSLAGAALQALVRNPLADPYVLGVSSGASLGAVAVMTLGAASLGGLPVPGAAFLAAAAVLAAVYAFAQRAARSRIRASCSPVSRSATSRWPPPASSSCEPNRRSCAASCSGPWGASPGPAGRRYRSRSSPSSGSARGCSRRAAHSTRSRSGTTTRSPWASTSNAFGSVLLAASAVLTAVAVSVAGGIGFIGLIVPHIMRMAVGADHRILLPASALGGAVMLVGVDLVARTVGEPRTSTRSRCFTALIGGPFFLWLMRARRTRSAT